MTADYDGPPEPLRVVIEAIGAFADRFYESLRDAVREEGQAVKDWQSIPLGQVALRDDFSARLHRAASEGDVGPDDQPDLALFLFSLQGTAESLSSGVQHAREVSRDLPHGIPVCSIVIGGRGEDAMIKEIESFSARLVLVEGNGADGEIPLSNASALVLPAVKTILSEYLFGVLRIETHRILSLHVAILFLFDLENAYDTTRVFQSMFGADISQEPQLPLPVASIDIAEHMKRERTRLSKADVLNIYAVSMHSPGIWDFLGKWNVLDFIAKYLNDQHERRKDKDYRESAEKRRLELENKLLENKVVSERIKIAKDAGLAPVEIFDAIEGPLIRLVEMDLVTRATMVSRGSRRRSTAVRNQSRLGNIPSANAVRQDDSQ